jgi:hypothetical protein
MTKPLITIHNVETDEIITREMNAEEYAQYEKDIVDTQARESEAAAKSTARQAILDRLGLTADEAATLLG